MNTLLLNINNLNVENVTIAFVGMLIVFIALTLLYACFRLIPVIMEWQIKRNMRKKGLLTDKKQTGLRISSGVNAAIGAAIYLYMNEMHDEENAKMTIKKVSKTYSPWSSKIYSMRWPLR